MKLPLAAKLQSSERSLPSRLRSRVLALLLTAASAAVCNKALHAQTEQLEIAELHTVATLTFEPVAGSPSPYLAVNVDSAQTNPSPAIAVTVDCLGHHERFLRTADHAILPIPRNDKEQLETGVPQRVHGLRQDPSRLFFTTTKPRTLLFFFSEAEAGEPGALYVLGFHPDGSPYRVLVAANFDLRSVEYGPAAEVRIIGTPSASEVYGNDPDDTSANAPYAATYDPYTVYLVHGDNAAVSSLPLSKAYNLRHYVWAGPAMSEKIAVLYNLPGHRRPFVAPDSQVSDLLAQARKAGQKHP